MNCVATARTPARNLWAFGRWNFNTPLHSFAGTTFACLSASSDFLLENQLSSTGAQAPKSRPQPDQCEGFGHQLSCLSL
jgi:hypothetical protein